MFKSGCELENMDYITTFAPGASSCAVAFFYMLRQTVCSDLPGKDAPFGHLELLVRDWVNYEAGLTREAFRDVSGPGWLQLGSVQGAQELWGVNSWAGTDARASGRPPESIESARGREAPGASVAWASRFGEELRSNV